MNDSIQQQYKQKELFFLDIVRALPERAPLDVLHLTKQWDLEIVQEQIEVAKNDEQTLLRGLILALENTGHDVERMVEDAGSLQGMISWFWQGMSEGLGYDVQQGRMTEWRADALAEQRCAAEVLHWIRTDLVEYVGIDLPDYWGDIDDIIHRADEGDRRSCLQTIREWQRREWNVPDPDDNEFEVVVIVRDEADYAMV